MSEITVLSCDLCKRLSHSGARGWAVERFKMRSLSNGASEYVLDLCKKHRDQLISNLAGNAGQEITGGTRTAVGLKDRRRRAAKVAVEHQQTYTCSYKGCSHAPFTTKQGTRLHELRVHEGLNPNAGRKKTKQPA